MMIDGYVTLFWDSGIQRKIPLFGRLIGLKHDGRRPITYVVTLLYGEIDATEVARLNQWLRTVPQALRGPMVIQDDTVTGLDNA